MKAEKESEERKLREKVERDNNEASREITIIKK